jgi:hypothetical protein
VDQVIILDFSGIILSKKQLISKIINPMSIPTQPKPYGIYTPPSLMHLKTTSAAVAALVETQRERTGATVAVHVIRCRATVWSSR